MLNYFAIPGCDTCSTPESIIKHVAYKLNVKIEEMMSRNRNANIVEARQIAQFFIIKINKSLSFEKCGKLFNRNHSTVINSIKVVYNRIDTEKNYRQLIEDFNKDFRLKTYG